MFPWNFVVYTCVIFLPCMVLSGLSNTCGGEAVRRSRAAAIFLSSRLSLLCHYFVGILSLCHLMLSLLSYLVLAEYCLWLIHRSFSGDARVYGYYHNSIITLIITNVITELILIRVAASLPTLNISSLHPIASYLIVHPYMSIHLPPHVIQWILVCAKLA